MSGHCPAAKSHVWHVVWDGWRCKILRCGWCGTVCTHDATLWGQSA